MFNLVSLLCFKTCPRGKREVDFKYARFSKVHTIIHFCKKLGVIKP